MTLFQSYLEKLLPPQKLDVLQRIGGGGALKPTEHSIMYQKLPVELDGLSSLSVLNQDTKSKFLEGLGEGKSKDLSSMLGDLTYKDIKTLLSSKARMQNPELSVQPAQAPELPPDQQGPRRIPQGKYLARQQQPPFTFADAIAKNMRWF